MTEFIDISVSLSESLPTWPNSIGLKTRKASSIDDGDAVSVTILECDVHAGTHIDAPSHYIKNGASVEYSDINVLIGPAFVVDLPTNGPIKAFQLSQLVIPPGTQRLLLKTNNSFLWHKKEFTPNYSALTLDAAKWIINQNIKLVGIDYMSIEPFGKKPEVHPLLLNAGIILLEGLDLSMAITGLYELICLPIRLAGAEAAPARAVLRKYNLDIGGKIHEF